MNRSSEAGVRESFQVRRMRPDETHLIREWAAEEGWNPGLYDAECFFAVDPQGFFIGEVDGQPVAMIACVPYDSSYGFLGLYIVKSGFRGRQYGMRTWDAGMKYLGERTVGLDGVLAQQQNYERSGFRFAYHHVRYEGRFPRVERSVSIPDIVPLADVSEADVIAYDTACSPAPRPEFLRRWIRLRGAAGVASIRDGKLRGFGLVRPCVDGFKIGPLLADDAVIADALLRGLIAAVPAEASVQSVRVFLDVPDGGKLASAAPKTLALHFGMNEVFRTARMYTRDVPSYDRVFGIATMELG